MNRSFKSIWNEAQGAWVAVSEIAKGRGKKSRAGASVGIVAIALTTSLLAVPAAAQTLIDNSGVSFGGNASAAVEIGQAGGSTQGFLTARVALTAANVFGLTGNTMTAGMQVYNTATTIGANGVSPGLYTWNGAQWISNNEVPYFHSNSTAVGNSTSANSGALGAESVAAGPNALANGQSSIAVGDGARAATLAGLPVVAAVAIGRGARAAADSTIAIGDAAISRSANAISVGTLAIARGINTIAIGASANAQRASTVAIGDAAFAGDTDTIAIGRGANTGSNGAASIAIGQGATITGTNTFNNVLIGTQAAADNQLQTALGAFSKTSGAGATAVGHDSSALTDGVALGGQAQANSASVAVGLQAGKGSTAASNAINVGAYSGLNSTGQFNAFVGYAAGNGANGSFNSALGRSLNGSTGSFNVATGEEAGSNITGSHNIASGSQAGYLITGDKNIALGYTAGFGVNADSTVSVGTGASASKSNAIAIGSGAVASGTSSISIGTGNIVSGNNSAAIGDPSTITGSGSYSVGNNNTIAANNAFVLGSNVTIAAGLDGAVGIGNNSTVAASTVASYNPGSGAVAGTAIGSNVVSVGGIGSERRITNLAAGGADTDAVNVSQLKKAVSSVDFPIRSTGSQPYTTLAGGGTDALAAGSNARAIGQSATALGEASNASGYQALAIGAHATTLGTDTVAIGTFSNSVGNGTVAIGNNAKSTGNQSVAVGQLSNSAGTYATALGTFSSATANNATAVGGQASATALGGVALGYTSVAGVPGGATGFAPTGASAAQIAAINTTNSTTLGAVSVGTGAVGGNRQIVNVAAGTNASDAVNVSQLQAVSSAAAAGATHYYSVNDNGVQGGNYANDGATGLNALAAGVGAAAGGISSVAMGNNASASAQDTVAIGTNAKTNTFQVGNIAIGAQTASMGVDGVAIGSGAKVGEQFTSGPFNGATVGSNSVAIGKDAFARDQSSIAMGWGAQANSGRTDNSEATYQTAIGAFSVAKGSGATALGGSAYANGDTATAVGYGAQAQYAGSVALGYSAATGPSLAALQANLAYNPQPGLAVIAGTTPAGEVSVGASGREYRITNLAAGAADTDAVNVSQLKAVSSALSAVDFPIRSGNAGPYTTTATGLNALAVGSNANATSDYATAVGENTVAGLGSTAVGGNATATGTQAIAIGNNAEASGTLMTAIGSSAGSGATGFGSTAIGYSAGAGSKGDLNAFVGAGAGFGAVGNENVAIGNASGTNVAANRTVALGSGALASVTSSVALGSGAVSDRAVTPSNGSIPAGSSLITYNTTDRTLLGAVSVGNATSYRQITNVADGTQSQDAVTVRQLTGALQSFAVTPTKYFHANSAAADSLAVGSESVAVGPQTVVNGNNAIGIGNGATVQISAPGSIAIGQGANTQLADSIAMGTNASAAAVQGIALGAGSIVNAAGGVALGAGSVASTAAGAKGYVPTGASTAQTAAVNATTSTLAGVSVGNAATGQLRQINGVAAGSIDSDAVNVSQLKAVQTAVVNIDNNAVKYDTTAAGTTNYNSVNLGNSNSTGPVTLGNVANGVAPNDAVNVQQLTAGVASANAYTDARVNGLQGNIDGVARKAYAGVASAMALESAPYIAGKTTYAAGMGYYQSQGAVGIALRRTADNGRWSVTGGVSASAGGVAVRAGVSGIWE